MAHRRRPMPKRQEYKHTLISRDHEVIYHMYAPVNRYPCQECVDFYDKVLLYSGNEDSAEVVMS